MRISPSHNTKKISTRLKSRTNAIPNYSLHVAPIWTNFCIHQNRNLKFVNAFHHFLSNLGEPWNFRLGAFEKKLVMDLQNHAGLQFFFGEATIEFDHSQFDEIGSRALHGGIHGGAFRKIAEIRLRRIDFGNWANAAEKSFRDPSFAGLGDLPIQKVLHSTVTFEILGDESRRLFLVNAQILCQTKRRKPINHAKIDDLGHPTMLPSLCERSHIEDLLGGARMDIFAALEGLRKHGIFREMR